MNIETPLEEVAQHLPTEAASFLLAQPSEVQMYALMSVRLTVSSFEANGAQMDPMTYDAVVSALTSVFVGAGHDAINLRRRMAQIHHMSEV